MNLDLILKVLAVVFMLIETFKAFLNGPNWVKATNWMTFSFALVLIIVFFPS